MSGGVFETIRVFLCFDFIVIIIVKTVPQTTERIANTFDFLKANHTANHINSAAAEIKEYEEGCWVNCIAPDEDEVDYLLDFFDIPPELLRSALDEEESAHIDSEDDTTLIIIDVPVVEKVSGSITYSTMPIGIMITEKNVITVSLRENTIITEFSGGLRDGSAVFLCLYQK